MVYSCIRKLDFLEIVFTDEIVMQVNGCLNKSFKNFNLHTLKLVFNVHYIRCLSTVLTKML